jgi:hypothetical protein
MTRWPSNSIEGLRGARRNPFDASEHHAIQAELECTRADVPSGLRTDRALHFSLPKPHRKRARTNLN